MLRFINMFMLTGGVYWFMKLTFPEMNPRDRFIAGVALTIALFFSNREAIRESREDNKG